METKFSLAWLQNTEEVVNADDERIESSATETDPAFVS